jgi:predicted DNA-binding transcriptional regulator AlpA
LEVSQRRDFERITTDLFCGTGVFVGVLVFCNAATKDPTMPATATQKQPDSLLRVEPHITQRMGISRSGWWKGVKDGKFPPGIKLSPRVTVWKSSDIDTLIASLGK